MASPTIHTIWLVVEDVAFESERVQAVCGDKHEAAMTLFRLHPELLDDIANGEVTMCQECGDTFFEYRSAFKGSGVQLRLEGWPVELP